MNTKVREESIKEVIKYHMCLKSAPQDDKFFRQDYGADSLDEVELIMAFEEKYDIEIPDEDFVGKEDMTIKEIVDYVSKKVNS